MNSNRFFWNAPVEFRSMGFWMRSQVIIIAPMYMFLLTKIGNWVIVSHELKYRR